MDSNGNPVVGNSPAAPAKAKTNIIIDSPLLFRLLNGSLKTLAYGLDKFDAMKEFLARPSRYIDGLVSNLSSLKPADISVTGDPPLCCNCSRLFHGQHYVGDAVTLARSFERVEASASLGCHLCSLLYTGIWNSIDARQCLLGDLAIEEALGGIYLANISPDSDRGFLLFAAATTAEMAALGAMVLQLRCVTGLPHVEMREFQQTKSLENVSLFAQQWIAKCEASQNCLCGDDDPGRRNEDGTRWMPTRLLYVGTGGDLMCDTPGLPRLRLCLSAGLPAGTQYMTLSHCWGTQEIFSLLLGNVKDLLETVPIDQLSNVFRDAIELTRSLGIDYIWIDSLCIIQDSFDDWAYESTMMNSVYQYSYLNIAASGSKDGTVNLFSQQPRVSAMIPRKVTMNLRETTSLWRSRISKEEYFLMEHPWMDVSSSPLFKRAWVLQELTLARRVLHLGIRQVLWECSCFRASESFPDGMLPQASHVGDQGDTTLVLKHPSFVNFQPQAPNNDHMPDPKRQEVYRLWEDIIIEYSRKSLTMADDKLVAISGIAREFQIKLEEEYVAGLWANNLIAQLRWVVFHTKDTLVMEFPKKYQAPSWSWAAVDKVVFLPRILRPSAPWASVVNHSIATDSGDEFGRIISGRIRLSCLLRKGFLVPRNSNTMMAPKQVQATFISTCSPQKLAVSLVPDYSTETLLSEVRNGRGAVGRQLWLMPLFDELHTTNLFSGLILKHSSSGSKGEYQRIGVFGVPYNANEVYKCLDEWRCDNAVLDADDYERYENGMFIISII